jgi:hypothetical protein
MVIQLQIESYECYMCLWPSCRTREIETDPAFTKTVHAYIGESRETRVTLTLTYDSKNGILKMNDIQMKLLRDTTDKVKTFGGKKNGTHYKLIVPTMDGLTANVLNKGICHVVSLWAGDRFEKDLMGNFFVFDRLI